MPTRRRRASSRPCIYRTVTDRIIAELRAGRVPWVKPWKTAGAATRIGLPSNTVSRKSYSGINILLLWSAAMDRGWAVQRWLTFRQAKLLGGHVRKGEHGETIFYAKRVVLKAERERAEIDGDEAQSVPMLRAYTVFNVEQCDDLPEEHSAGFEAPDLEDTTIEENAKHLIGAVPAHITHGGDRAFYNIAGDFIRMPKPASFPEPLDYTRTLIHELGHWTGHSSRLSRQYGKRFGDQAYAREELVAEISAAFVSATLGIEPTLRHSAYLASWLEVLEEDDKAIFRAASHATAASDFLLAYCADEAEPLDDDRLAA